PRREVPGIFGELFRAVRPAAPPAPSVSWHSFRSVLLRALTVSTTHECLSRESQASELCSSINRTNIHFLFEKTAVPMSPASRFCQPSQYAQLGSPAGIVGRPY